MLSFPRASSLVALLALPGSALAARGPDLPCPLSPISGADVLAGVELAVDPETAAALAAIEHVTLTGAPLGDGRLVDLEVERVRASTSGIEVVVDGVRSTWAPPADASCWKGRVAGEPDSDVFLGVSRFGTRGWIRTQGETWHVLASRGALDDWSQSRARVVGETALARLGLSHDFVCPVDTSVARSNVRPPAPTGGTSALAVVDMLECRMAIETDYQLFQRFSSLTAEQNYLSQFFAASSAQYQNDLTTALSIVYLGLHTASNDGWTSGDTGAGSGAMLDEFRTAWAGSIPNGAHLAHFLSGAGLGGGVAYLNVLCNPQWGFAVSGDLAGNTPFPVTQGPLTWDFMVFNHETGHNFAAPHTHDMCPPVDLCAPNGYFGSCQSTQVCISNGTIMSYCHLCAGGMSNVALHFHPASATIMRAAAENSCIPTLCVAPVNYCASSPNSYDIFGAQISYFGTNRISQNDLMLATTSVPPGVFGLYYYGRNATFVSFGSGVRCIASPTFRLPIVQANPFAEVDFQIDYATLPSAGPIHAGETWNFQLWYRNPGGGGAGFNLSDGLRIQFCP